MYGFSSINSKGNLNSKNIYGAVIIEREMFFTKAEIALPFINFVYKEHPEMHDKNIYVPVTDGRHVYQIPVNVKAAYDSDRKSVV